MPALLGGLFEAWRLAPSHGCGLTLGKVAPCAILLSIWKEWHDRIFKGAMLQVEEVLHLVIYGYPNGSHIGKS